MIFPLSHASFTWSSRSWSRFFRVFFGFEPDLAADHSRPSADEAHDRKSGDALAASTFAHHAQGLPLAISRLTPSTDRINACLLLGKVRSQVLYLQERRVLHRFLLPSRILFRPSPSRWKPRMVKRMARAGAVEGRNLPCMK